MIWLKLKMLAATMLVWLSCSGAIKEVPVPVVLPTCDVGEAPLFPSLKSSRPSEGGVEISPDDAVELIVFKGDYKRFLERQQVCRDTLHWNRPVFNEQVHVSLTLAHINKMTGMNIPVSWRWCGEYNGYYDTEKKSIELCLDLLEVPHLASGVLVHELGHALQYHRDLAWPTLSGRELFADEFAAWYLIKSNDLAPLRTMETMLAQADYVPPIGSTHPRPAERVYNFKCWRYATGEVCKELRRQLFKKWDKEVVWVEI